MYQVFFMLPSCEMFSSSS